LRSEGAEGKGIGEARAELRAAKPAAAASEVISVGMVLDASTERFYSQSQTWHWIKLGTDIALHPEPL